MFFESNIIGKLTMIKFQSNNTRHYFVDESIMKTVYVLQLHIEYIEFDMLDISNMDQVNIGWN